MVRVKESSLMDLYFNFNASNMRSRDESPMAFIAISGECCYAIFQERFPSTSPRLRFDHPSSTRSFRNFSVLSFSSSCPSSFPFVSSYVCLLYKQPPTSSSFSSISSISSISSSYPPLVFSSSREGLIMPTMSLRFLTENYIIRH